MTFTRKFTAAVLEYLVGLGCSPGVRRALAAVCVMGFAAAALAGMVDVASGWRMDIPLWLHVCVTVVFALCLASALQRHVQRTRALGRDRLGQSA